jgi:hypothetical protein
MKMNPVRIFIKNKDLEIGCKTVHSVGGLLMQSKKYNDGTLYLFMFEGKKVKQSLDLAGVEYLDVSTEDLEKLVNV